MFDFAKLEALEQEAEESTADVSEPSETDTAVDNLDVSSDVKEEIKDIIEEAVSEVVETIEEGNAASDEVEETTTQIDETVEQTESLLHLQAHIKKYGLSAATLDLIDRNGSFRKACQRTNSSISFESLSVTPSFGIEQKVALETIGDSLKSAGQTVWTFIQKAINFIKTLFSKFLDLFRNYQKQVEQIGTELKKVNESNIKPDLIKSSISSLDITGSDFARQVHNLASANLDNFISSLVKATNQATALAKNDDPNIAKEFDTIKADLARGYGGKVENNKFVPTTTYSSRTNVKPEDWKLSHLTDSTESVKKLAIALVDINNKGKAIISSLENAAKAIKNLQDKDDSKAALTAISSYTSFIMQFINYYVTKEAKYLVQTYVKVGRIFINAHKAPNKESDNKK